MVVAAKAPLGAASANPAPTASTAGRTLRVILAFIEAASLVALVASPSWRARRVESQILSTGAYPSIRTNPRDFPGISLKAACAFISGRSGSADSAAVRG